jgi:polysaccharide deacetylase family protein (PEP-CTERM system associated)
MPNDSPGDGRAHAPAGRSNLLTIALEDYYHNFGRVIERSHWHRFERRVERSTLRALDLLDEFGISATFFTLGWVANTLPEVVREVARRGHEIASKGYHQRSLRDLSPAEFRDDLHRAREALERASGQHVVGYRAPGWIRPSDLWALQILAEEGYVYDSSIKPFLTAYASEPHRWLAHPDQFGDRTLWSFPISTIRVAGLSIPVGAGNYFRQLPDALIQRVVAQWERRHDAPFTMYFHTWELDPDQPQITAASPLARIRFYRNLDKVPRILRHYFSRYHFVGIRGYLGLPVIPVPSELPDTAPVPVADEPARAATRVRPVDPGTPPRERMPVTVVVPCYNEEHALPYLSNTLDSVEASIGDRYALQFIFVDDHSTDATWSVLHRLFGEKPNCTLLQHARNRGAAIAILTGLRAARTPVVASIDCDCTYDPHELEWMIPLLSDGVDLVTGSPYHGQGSVRNVPSWRLALSKSASAMYRVLLRQKLATYTSCFRVYRRSSVLDVVLDRGGYLGIAEMIGKLDLAGSCIVEYPTTLDQRVLGYSKMKVVRTVLGHLSLMLHLARLRWGLAHEAPVAHETPDGVGRCVGDGSVPRGAP